ncbi:hypothetical protein HN51_043348 [Arachis hypogaea]
MIGPATFPYPLCLGAGSAQERPLLWWYGLRELPCSCDQCSFARAIPRLAHLVGRGEALGTPISFFGAVSFPVPPPRHSASLPVLRKNLLTSPFFIDLGEKEPSTSWQARHQKLSLRVEALKERDRETRRHRNHGTPTSKKKGKRKCANAHQLALSPYSNITPSFTLLGCWIRDPRSRLDPHPAERGQPLEATRAKRSAFATEKANGQREGSRLSRALAKLDSHSEALRVSEAL